MQKPSEEAEIFFSKNISSSLTAIGDKIKTKEISQEEGFGIRVKSNNQIGFSFCATEQEIKRTIQRAIKISKYSPKTKFEFSQKTKMPKWNNFDNQIDPTDIEFMKDQIDSILSITNERKVNSKIVVSQNNTQIKLENHNGLAGEYKTSLFSAYIEFMNEEGSGFSYISSPKKPKKLEERANEAMEIAALMKKAKKFKETKDMKMVFHLSALENLIEILMPSFSGDWSRRKITKLKKEEETFSEILNITDDPLLEMGVGSRPFDDEGVISTKKELVKKGVVKNFLFDRETAALANVEDGGNCSRSNFDSRPTISQSNIFITKGTTKDFAEIGEHLEIISAHGSHTSNPTTGEFGLEVNAAIHKKGNIEKPVKGFLISGNIFEIFKEIEAVGIEEEQFGNLFSPKIAFSKIKAIG